ncbi:hypothetical protein C0993_007408 [Termitomyces sp. T159_Od127]|nr:hypothetical protein C0993_007408 [Termitomyces sp. T159_Od127]
MDRPARPTTASTGQSMLLFMPMWSIATSAGQSAVVILASVALTGPKAPGVRRAMDKEMVVVGAGGAVPPSKGTMGQPRHRPPAEAPGPSKTHQGQKPPLAASQLEIVDFPANIPEQTEAAQMLFMKAIVFLRVETAS